MRKLITCLAVAALAAPAFAETLKEVTTKGVVLSVQGFDIDVVYKPDGTFAASLPGDPTPVATGKWRIDGDKLCTSTDATPEECVAYPKDKKSGDSFEVTGAQGAATIKIK
jgi:hypothetical protein